ncbi:MAG: hypothetical protein ABW252_18345 [Polyangiales bacterium]
MSRSTRPRSSRTVPLSRRVARRWREGVVISNLSVAGYLSQLPRIEDAIFGRGMLTTLSIGVGAGLAWMLVRGALSSPIEMLHEPVPSTPPPRASQRPLASAPPSPRIRTIAPPGAPAPRASMQPEPPRPSASQRPYVQPQSGETMAGYPGHAAPLPELPPAPRSVAPHANQTGATLHGASPPIDPRAFAPHTNQTGSTLHGWSSSPPGAYGTIPPQASGSAPPNAVGAARKSFPRPEALADTRQDDFAEVRSRAFAHDEALAHARDSAVPSRPSGPPTTRMSALQEAELSASPDASRAAEPASDARLSWPPLELAPRVRSNAPREGSLPPPQVPMGVLSRAMPTPPPANDGVVATYIDTVGEPAVTVGVSSTLPPDERPHARAAIARRVAARVEVVHGEASAPEGRLEPELRDQLEELRAEVLTMSPSHCFVVGVSSDAEHSATKSTLAVDLALQLAHSGSRRVLLIEGNATRPMLDRALSLHVPLAAGFSQQMHRRMTAVAPSWTVLRVAPTLDVLAEGRFRTPGMLYGSVFAVALHELRDHYDVIVADGPVVETSEAAAAFAQVVDGIGYVTSGLPSIRVPRERALARFKDKPLFKVMTSR